MYLFSKKNKAFYPVAEKQLYIAAGTLPDDVIEVSADTRDVYNGLPPIGQKLGADDSGLPIWVEKSHVEYVANADFLRKMKIDEANSFMSSKQWPGKAALGRLKGVELEQYSKWLDYLDALETVDTSNAPDVEWPTQPEASAN